MRYERNIKFAEKSEAQTLMGVQETWSRHHMAKWQKFLTVATCADDLWLSGAKIPQPYLVNVQSTEETA